jgi:hypothetical protein
MNIRPSLVNAQAFTRDALPLVRARGIAAESPQDLHWQIRGLGAESPVFCGAAAKNAPKFLCVYPVCRS